MIEQRSIMILDRGILKEKIASPTHYYQATEKMWRLVHDGDKVISLHQGTEKSMTTSVHPIEEFSTEEKALEKMNEFDPNKRMEVEKI